MGWKSNYFKTAPSAFTADATMTAGDIVYPATGYGAAGSKLTGTLVKNPTTDPLVYNPNVVMYPMHVMWYIDGDLGAEVQSGAFSDLPPDLKYLVTRSNSTYTGSLSDIPRSVIGISFGEDISTLEGDLKDLPSGLTRLYMPGASIVTGDLADLPVGLTEVNLAYCSLLHGVYTPNAYTSWINLNETNMSAADTDATLIALAAITEEVTTERGIFTCGNRTSASDAAVTALLTAGWMVDSETLP